MNSLQRINLEYISRIASAFDGTIKAIRIDDNASSDEQENLLRVELADQLELLKGQVSDFLSLTFEEETKRFQDILCFSIVDFCVGIRY